MKTDLHKVWVVASTEFGSTVRTKSFIIGLLLLPVIMGASILLQLFVADRVDTRTRKFVVIDPGATVYPAIESAAKSHNEKLSEVKGKEARMPMEPKLAEAPSGSPVQDSPALDLELSDKIRRSEFDAYVVIPSGVLEAAGPDAKPAPVLYHSNNPNDDSVRKWLEEVVNNEVRARRFRAAGLDQALAERLSQPVTIENRGLVERSELGDAGSTLKSAEKVDQVRTAAVPAVLMFVMFFVIMTSAPQLLNSVIEEKMSRISEVLLGSVTPFELMMGKLIGNAGIAMLLASLYVAGGFIVAAYHGYANVVSPGLMVAFAFFLLLAILLFGSMYIAVGSACSELKDAQSLMMPVMLLSMFPIFVWNAVLRNPESPLSVGMSLFPPATPFLMLMRLALQPSPPAWQVGLGVVLTTLTAVATVWAAGKIFRTGLLMQGKAPSFAELARWVMAK
jgi:ABC-type Na+ efflux pump permease subunit